MALPMTLYRIAFVPLSLGVLAAMSACATGRHEPARGELEEVARNCELPEAKLIGISDQPGRYWLAIPAEAYARRNEPPVQGRIACVSHWAREGGLRITVTVTPADEALRAKRHDQLREITAICELPEAALTFRDTGELLFRPAPDTTYAKVECAIRELRKADIPMKIGFVAEPPPGAEGK